MKPGSFVLPPEAARFLRGALLVFCGGQDAPKIHPSTSPVAAIGSGAGAASALMISPR